MEIQFTQCYKVWLLLFCFLVHNQIGNAQITDEEKYEQANKYYNAKEYNKAIPILNELVTRNHVKAFNLLGVCYNNGYGVKKDVDKAYEYYLKGAEKGNCHAQRNLAWLFQDNDFMEKHTSGEGDSYHEDYDFKRQTEKWLRIAAQNNADYMYELAGFYLDLLCLDEWQDKDPNIYLQKAADAGSANAQACIGYMKMLEGNYDDAIKMFLTVKEKGIKTFWSFDYAESEELNIDDCLMILQYIRKNVGLKLKHSRKYTDESYILSISKGEGNEGLIVLSKSGSVVEKTPYFHNIWLVEDPNEHQHYPYIGFSTSSYNDTQDVYFLNKKIQLNIMDGIYQFSQNNQGLKIQSAHYNGGEHIYISVSNDKEQYSYIKINKTGEIIKSIPFVKDKIYVICDDEKINLAYGKNIYLIDSSIDLDVIFTVFEFLLSNTDYSLDSWEALFINNSYLLLHGRKRSEDTYYRWSNWFKLSTTGKILGKTTAETDNEVSYYPSDEKYFHYYDSKAEREIKFNLQEMLKRIK